MDRIQLKLAINALERFTIGCTVLPPAGNRAATVRERWPGRLLTRAARTVSSYRTGKEICS